MLCSIFGNLKIVSLPKFELIWTMGSVSRMLLISPSFSLALWLETNDGDWAILGPKQVHSETGVAKPLDTEGTIGCQLRDMDFVFSLMVDTPLVEWFGCNSLSKSSKLSKN